MAVGALSPHSPPEMLPFLVVAAVVFGIPLLGLIVPA
jgi:hypothetical protein